MFFSETAPLMYEAESKSAGDDVAIRCEGLGKCYEIYDKPGDRLKQFIYPRLSRAVPLFRQREPRAYYREFWALRDVSFEIKRGETLGIIGRNGSGKSTLLQMICGTLNPTAGTIHTRGRIAALLELGSGFNPEFTGRENVYLNAALLGLSKEETDARFTDIASFADIGAFIEQPVKTYSSGMMVRLAFAVQAQVAPDILIVDEALAVGDAKFQAKCFERLKQLKENGTSILLVTHSSEQIVSHCSQALLLNAGCAVTAGEPRHVVNRYMDLLFGKERGPTLTSASHSADQAESGHSAEMLSHVEDVFATRPAYNPHEYRWGDGTASILDFNITADGESFPSAITTGQKITLSISTRFHATLVRPVLGITIKTKEGVTVYGANSETLESDDIKYQGAKDTVMQAKAEFVCRLAPGDYFVSLGIATRQGEEIVPHDRRYDAIHLHVSPVSTFFGLINLDLKLSAAQRELS